MEPTYRSLNARVFSRRCAGCHNSVTLSGGLDLTTYTKVVSVITPNDAATSKIYMRVSGSSPGANRMPLGGAPLSDLEIGAIAAWINAGALNN